MSIEHTCPPNQFDEGAQCLACEDQRLADRLSFAQYASRQQKVDRNMQQFIIELLHTTKKSYTTKQLKQKLADAVAFYEEKTKVDQRLAQMFAQLK